MAQTSAVALFLVVLVVASVSAGPILPAVGGFGLGMYGGLGLPYYGMGLGMGYGYGLGMGVGMGVMPYTYGGLGYLGLGGLGYGMPLMGGVMSGKYYD